MANMKWQCMRIILADTEETAIVLATWVIRSENRPIVPNGALCWLLGSSVREMGCAGYLGHLFAK
jgi:hypothetical protein